MDQASLVAACKELETRHKAANTAIGRCDQELRRLQENRLIVHFRQNLKICETEIKEMNSEQGRLAKENQELSKEVLKLNHEIAQLTRHFQRLQQIKFPSTQKILVLGASGTLGLKISEVLLHHGHNVSLTYFRNKIELSQDCIVNFGNNFSEVACDLNKWKEQRLQHIVKGYSIVISSVIVGGSTHLESKANMTRIVQKMINVCRACGVLKLILIAGEGVLKTSKDSEERVCDTWKGESNAFERSMTEAHLENIEYLRQTYSECGMEWVVYAPPDMKNTEDAEPTPIDKVKIATDVCAGSKTKYIDLANVIAVNLNNTDFNQHCISTSFET